MTYRKTWFSYVLWILYTILCVVSLVVLAGGVWTAYLAGIPYGKGFPATVIAPFAGLSDNILILLGLLILPCTVLLYWVIRGVAGMIRKKCTWKKRAVWVWECIVVFLILAGGVALRVMYAEYVISMADNEWFAAEQISGMEYYDMAVVSAGDFMPHTLDRMSALYVLCLSVVLSFLGNKIASAVILQIFLQIAGMLLAYVVTRKIAGRLPACIVLIYLACSFCCLKMLVCFGPEWLFFVLYMIDMLIMAGFIQGYCANRLSRPAALLGAAAVGAMIGALACIEPAAASILLMIVAVATGRKKRQETMPVYNSAGVSAAVMIVTIIAYGFIMFGAAYLGSYEERFDLGKLKIWYEYSSGFMNRWPYLYDIYVIGLLIVPASFLVFEFFRSGRDQNYMLWILLCIIVAPTPMAAIGEQKFGLLSFYIWAVLAGLGLQNCIFGGRAKVMQAVIEEINSEAEKAEEEKAEESEEIRKPVAEESAETSAAVTFEETGKAESVVTPAESVKVENAVTPEESERAENTVMLVESAEARSVVTPEEITKEEFVAMSEQTVVPEVSGQKQEDTVTPEMSEAAAAQNAQKPRYIENPLPLPKKHVKREMDYQYTVEEKDMKYDVEVSENDDFDIP